MRNNCSYESFDSIPRGLLSIGWSWRSLLAARVDLYTDAGMPGEEKLRLPLLFERFYGKVFMIYIWNGEKLWTKNTH